MLREILNQKKEEKQEMNTCKKKEKKSRQNRIRG